MYYEKHAQEYFNDTVNIDMKSSVKDFLTYVNGNKILDLGCGSGRDSKIIYNYGYDVTSIDSSIELSKIASNYIGKEVINMDIRNINYKNTFNGIYASASLHHLKKEELLHVFDLLYDSLVDDGILYTMNKYGTFEGMIEERYFTYFNDELINYILNNTGFRLMNQNLSLDKMGRDSNWLTLVLKK